MAKFEINYEGLDADENKKDGIPYEEFLEWAETVIFALLTVILVFTFLLRQATVDGESMLPTLESGEKLVVHHLFYEPQVGDIVIINNIDGHVYNEGGELVTVGGLRKAIVKRVIAKGGDELNIDFDTGEVTVNGTVLDEPYIADLTQLDEYGHNFPVKVPEGYYFVMGDNRMRSCDSRDARVGFVPEEDIAGKVVFRMWPAARIGAVE